MSSLLLVSAAWGGQLALGTAQVFDELTEGAGLSASYRHPVTEVLSVEARVGGYPGAAEGRIGSAAVALVEAAGVQGGFQQPVSVDAFHSAVLADLGPLRTPGRLQAAPHLRAGAGIAQHRDFIVSYDAMENAAVITGDGRQWTVPAIGELGVELWLPGRVGFRLSTGVVADVRPEPTYDPDSPATGRALHVRTRGGLELLVDLGER